MEEQEQKIDFSSWIWGLLSTLRFRIFCVCLWNSMLKDERCWNVISMWRSKKTAWHLRARNKRGGSEVRRMVQRQKAVKVSYNNIMVGTRWIIASLSGGFRNSKALSKYIPSQYLNSNQTKPFYGVAFINCLTCFICNLSCVYAREHETDRCFMVEYECSASACNKNVLPLWIWLLVHFTKWNAFHLSCAISLNLVCSYSIHFLFRWEFFFLSLFFAHSAFRLIPFWIHMTIIGWLRLKRNHCCGFTEQKRHAFSHYGESSTIYM